MSFHYSPDMGNYEHKGDKFYFETGMVIKATNFIRSIPSNHGIEYSKWSKKRRRKTLREIKKAK